MRQYYIAVPVSLIENMCKALSEYELTDGDWKACFDKIHDACVDIDAFCRDKLNVEALEQEPCGDAISRQAAIDACLNGWNKDYKEIVKEIRALPPVTPQPKMGRWCSTTIQGEMKVQGQIDGQIVEAFVCSECSAISVFRMADGKIVNGDLCPNCGAKMQEVEE